MMPIHTFDEQSAKLIADQVGQLRNRVHGLETELRTHRGAYSSGPKPFFGKTTTGAAPNDTYPTGGCQFVVQRIDHAWNDKATDECLVTGKTSIGQKVVARTIDGGHITENTEVLCIHVPGSHGGRWYIAPAASTPPSAETRQLLVRNDTLSTVPAYSVFALNGTVLQPATGTFTVDAGTDVFTSSGHPLNNDDTVTLTTTGTLPDPLAPATTYYVVNDSGSTFKLSLTEAGAAIDILDTGSGTHTYTRDGLAAWQVNPVTYKGIAPRTLAGSNGHWGVFCVSQVELDAGESGEAIISGETIIRVYKPGTAYSWRWLDIRDNSHLGQERHFGSCEILDSFNYSTSDRWARVRMGNWTTEVKRATADGTITAGSSGTVSFISSSENETAYHDVMPGTHDIGTSDKLLIWFDRETAKWRIINAEC